MPQHVKFNIDNYLKNIHDIRVYNFYRRFLYLNGMQISDVNYYTDIDSCRREITHIFDCADMDTQKKRFINENGNCQREGNSPVA